MHSSTEPSRAPARERRPRRLPAAALPVKRDSRRASSFVSMLLHLLVIVLLGMPAALHTGNVIEIEQGAGGPGPAGGGGGGRNGTGGAKERVQYIQTSPAPVPTPEAVVTPPPVVPPQPAIIPPLEMKPPEVTPPAKPDVSVAAKPAEIAPVPGVGGGTGKDGTNGNGPGSGGGVGSGIGTGRGAGVGPGTGGGTQANYPPTAIELFIPPLPMPAKVRGFHLVAEWDVDETGKVVEGGFKFTATPDRGYNRRLEEVLRSFKFRPGTTPDGKPIRMKVQITYDF